MVIQWQPTYLLLARWLAGAVLVCSGCWLLPLCDRLVWCRRHRRQFVWWKQLEANQSAAKVIHYLVVVARFSFERRSRRSDRPTDRSIELSQWAVATGRRLSNGRRMREPSKINKRFIRLLLARGICLPAAPMNIIIYHRRRARLLR